MLIFASTQVIFMCCDRSYTHTHTRYENRDQSASDMATRRRPINTNSTQFNFRPGGMDPQRTETKGTRPTTSPTSIREVLILALMHLCKKIIFFDVNLKVALYMGALFLVSLIGDFTPYPKTYLARSDNFFNVYFVKMGWAWTLAASMPFVALTSRVLCCGNTERLLKHHLLRLAVATAFWFVWTKSFNLIESSYGRCNVRNFITKSTCLKAGHFWNGFDISGHAFILVYSSLVLIEEARPIIGWEYIKEHLRNEEHNRATSEASTTNPLRNLDEIEFNQVKTLYEKYTPYIRFLFIAMAALQLLWDVMLVGTMLYYHKMIEKVLSGIIAILTWFVTYRTWYPTNSTLPNTAGSGQFIYQKAKPAAIPLRKPSVNSTAQRNNAAGRSDDIPKFMGMPLYTQPPSPQQQQFPKA